MSTAHRPFQSAPALNPPQPQQPQHFDLTTTAMEDFREIFHMFDTNKNGTIDFPEFNRILQMLGDDCPDSRTLDNMLRVACKTPSNKPVPTTLNFDQFMAFFAIYKQDWPAQVSTREIFSVLDDDNSGAVSPEDLGKVLTRFGMRVSQDEANAMADYATTKPGPNEISFANFATVADRVRGFRHASETLDTSDTSEDDNMTRV